MHQNRIRKGNKSYLKLKRRLRKEMTPAENMLWLRLRGRRFENFKFRRQHGIGNYIVDFYSPQKGLVIEVDGDVHVDKIQVEIDKKRENYLKKLGLRIIRYNNNDILMNLDGVMEDLFMRVCAGSTSPLPPPYKGGETTSPLPPPYKGGEATSPLPPPYKGGEATSPSPSLQRRGG